MKILAFAGSTRQGSHNKRLLRVAVAGAEQSGVEVTILDLADYPLPIMDQDLEARQGIPQPARQLKRMMIDHDGLLIASPEYNSAFSPLLKNALDWASRGEPGEPPLAAYRGKIAALVAASPGALGGLRGLVFLRMLLGNLGMVVVPRQLALPQAHQAFAEDGSLIDPARQEAALAVGRELAETVERLRR